MVTRKTGRPVGRPPDPAKSDVIVDIAWEMFLAQGFEGTTIEAIAQQAGVSKATIYKHFADKIAVFEAGVAREMRLIEATQNVSGGKLPGVSLEDTLLSFGMGIMGFLVSDHAVDFYNSLSGELRRHPELAQRFYEKGPGRTRANLADLLRLAAERGDINVKDPEQAAEHLFGLWQGFSNFQLSLGIGAGTIRASVEQRVRRGISVFLMAYG